MPLLIIIKTFLSTHLTLTHAPLHIPLQISVKNVQIERIDFRPEPVANSLRFRHQSHVVPGHAHRRHEFDVEQKLQSPRLARILGGQFGILFQQFGNVLLDELEVDLARNRVRNDGVYRGIQVVQQVLERGAGVGGDFYLGFEDAVFGLFFYVYRFPFLEIHGNS